MHDEGKQTAPPCAADDVSGHSVSGDADERFEVLQHQFYDCWLRYHPESAVDIGEAAFGGQLRPYEHDERGALITLNQKMLSALEEIPASQLSEDNRITSRLIAGAVRCELYELENFDWRRRNPLPFIPVNAIYQLLIHPGDHFHQCVKRRLEAIPGYLRGARTCLLRSPQTIVPLWLRAAVQMADAGAVFIRDLGRHSLMTARFSNPARLQPLLDEAALALHEFGEFLRNDIAPVAIGTHAIGALDFNRLLNQKHFFETTAEAVLALGERLRDETRGQLERLARQITGKDDVQACLEQIRQQHPDNASLLDEYRQRMRRAQQWVDASPGFPPLPAQRLTVQATPAFLSSLIPFAAYEPPRVNDDEQQGIFYVTQDGAQLAEHNYFSIDLTAVHEGFPGHHLQFVLANRGHGGRARLLHTSASLYEGWAMYAEQRAVESGFLDRPEHRFMMLRDRLWRALRIIIDVQLHTSAMTPEQAAAMLAGQLGFDHGQAMREVTWYAGSPTTPLCYAVGWEMIRVLGDVLQVETGEQRRDFHRSLLSQGSIALPLVIQRRYGEATWRAVHQRVFGEAGRVLS